MHRFNLLFESDVFDRLLALAIDVLALDTQGFSADRLDPGTAHYLDFFCRVHVQGQLANEPFEFFVFALQLVVVQHRNHAFTGVLPQPSVNRLGADRILLGQIRHALAGLHLTDDFFLDLFGYSSAHLMPPFCRSLSQTVVLFYGVPVKQC